MEPNPLENLFEAKNRESFFHRIIYASKDEKYKQYKSIFLASTPIHIVALSTLLVLP